VTEPRESTPGPPDGAQGDDIDSLVMSMLLTEAPTDPLRLHRMTIDQFEQMAAAELIPREARVELINGVLVDMSPIGDGHVFMVAKLHHVLVRLLEGRAAVFDQSSFECGDTSLPEPDLVAVPWPYERYARRRPNAGDAQLIIEVADSSLRYDRAIKEPLYARHGIPEYWLVDLVHLQVHVHVDPTADGYATTRTFTQDDTLVPTAFPDVRIPVRDLGLDLLGPEGPGDAP
jgi:Uma2 family endonuclease